MTRNVHLVAFGGGDPTGVADSTSALQSAISSAYGGVLAIPAGRFLIPSGLSITDSITIEMDPDTVLDYSGAAAGTALNQKKAISIDGTVDTAVTLDADIAVGDRQITFVTTGFAAGDWVIVKTDQQIMDGVSGFNVDRGHISRIKSIDSGTTATLVERSPFAYDASQNGTVQKINDVARVTIRGGTILGGGVGKAHTGISAWYTSDLLVDGVTIIDCEDVGVATYYSIAPKVIDCRIENCTSPGGSVGTTGYGTAFYGGTRDGLIQSNRYKYCRHPVAGGGYIISMNCTVRDNVSEDGGIGSDGYDCHEPCFWWSFEGNRAHGGIGGMVIRGQYTRVVGNSIHGVEGLGIRVRSYATNTDGITGTLIAHNRIFDVGGSGILLEGTSTTQRIYDTEIAHNDIQNVAYHGISMEFVDGVRIVGGRCSTTTSVAATNGSGVRLVGTTAGDNLNVYIDGIRITDMQRHGVHVEYTDSCYINAFVNNVGVGTTNSAAVWLDASDKVTINGGTYKHDGSSTYGVIAARDCDNLKVTDATIIGSVSNASQDAIRWYVSSGTNTGGTFSRNLVPTVGRYAIYTTDSDHIVCTDNDVTGAALTAKVVLSGAVDFKYKSNLAQIDYATAAQITGDQNDYFPAAATNLTRTIRLSSDAARTITGMSGGFSERRIELVNVGTQDIVLSNENAASTAANRFAIAADITLNAGEGVSLWYDASSSRWRCVGKNV